MAFIYESIQNGLFNFTIPGEDKTVKLLKGSRVKVKKKLAGSYLRVLKLVKEIPDEEKKIEIAETTTKPNAKVEDKIVKVEEVDSSIIVQDTMPLDENVVASAPDNIEVAVNDDITTIKEEEKPQAQKRKAPARKKQAPVK